MQTLAQFLSAQNDILDGFEQAARETRAEGIIPDPAIAGRMCGFFVNLTPSLPVARQAAELSRKIGEITPSTVRQEVGIHTTLASAIMHPGHVISPNNPKHSLLLSRLVNVARGTLCSLGARRITINYDRVGFCRTGVAITGTPNEEFVELMHKIVTRASEFGIKLNAARYAHITLGRFTKRRLPQDLTELFELLDTTPPPGESIPCRLNVWYNNCDSTLPLGHREVVYASIPI